MANVVLISCNLAREPYPVYPLGMTLVAEAARSRGHRVMQADLLQSGGAQEELICRIRDYRPDVIGLSIRNIDNCDLAGFIDYTDFGSAGSSTSPLGSDLAACVRMLREHTDCPVVLGGAG
jgi:hypothetical protein